MISVSKKFLVTSFSLASILCAAPVVAVAYDDRRATSRGAEDESNERMSKRDQRSLERYLDSHEEVARQLSQDPERIHDRQFIRDHASLEEWLDNHPEAEAALRANPHRYLREERVGRASEGQQQAHMSENDLRSFETFLDSNPETARRLYEEPELISDRQFTRNNAALDDWLDSHPRAAEAIKANPHKFLWRERSVNATDFLRQLLR